MSVGLHPIPKESQLGSRRARARLLTEEFEADRTTREAVELVGVDHLNHWRGGEGNCQRPQLGRIAKCAESSPRFVCQSRLKADSCVTGVV